MKYNLEEINSKANYCLNCKSRTCTKGCPLENDIPNFIKCIKEKKYQEAYNILSETTILHSICGRVCPHKKQCEGSCIRGIKSEAVSIGDLEAFIGDMAINENYEIKVEKESKNKSIAIVGGGPSGLTCAYFLKKRGYEVTIYEKHNKLGGILNHGIPEFRLDNDILNKTIERILNLGIEVRYKKELGKDYDLDYLVKNYDYVYLSFGANISSKMGIEGEDLEGVFGGNELLENNNHPSYIGKKIAVIGGGNVAIDTARTIKRLGAKEVKIIYRRSEKQMPAEKNEIEAAKKEKIEFIFQNNLVRILGKERVEKIECIKTQLTKKEGEVREVPIDIKNSNYLLDMDYVVMAIGSKTDNKIVSNLKINTTKWRIYKGR